jgi:hypothetical protein
MFKKILIANRVGIPVLRAFAPSREPKFLLFSREDAKPRRKSGIYGPGSYLAECAADVLRMLGHNMPPEGLDEAAG